MKTQQTPSERKLAIVKQIQAGIWIFPEQHVPAIVSLLNTCSTHEQINAWAHIMREDFPENRADAWKR